MKTNKIKFAVDCIFTNDNNKKVMGDLIAELFLDYVNDNDFGVKIERS